MSKRTTTSEFSRTRDVHVNRIYSTEVYVQGVPKPPEHISIANV